VSNTMPAYIALVTAFVLFAGVSPGNEVSGCMICTDRLIL